jgi:DNA-binding Xre family transcriptional regulator
MVTLRIKEVAVRNGIMTAYQLQKAAQLHPGHAAKLWKGEIEMIGLKTIDTLCEALNCDPSDLIVRDKNRKRVNQSA